MHPILEAPDELDEDEFLCDDEVYDSKVEMLETLIKVGHEFSSQEFVGGVPAGDRLEPRRFAKQEGPVSNKERTARTPAVKQKARSTGPSVNPSPQKKPRTEGIQIQSRVTRSQTKKDTEKRTKTIHFKQRQPGFEGESSTAGPSGACSKCSSDFAAMIADLKIWTVERENILKVEIVQELKEEMGKMFAP